MKYISTRGAGAVTGTEAIVRGIAPDGGLYVPECFPTLAPGELEAWAELDYATLAARVLIKFLPEYGLEELERITHAAALRFESDIVAPLVKVDEGSYFLELWHGPTHAFKDVALTTLPHLMTSAKTRMGIDKDILILVATSGDTGKAALEGFCDVAGTKCGVLYPADGVSELQKLQMTTQRGANVRVWGIDGNFDDAQSAVKRIFTDPAIADDMAAHGVMLSSANSINLGRLLPQIVYYFSAYLDLANSGEIEMGEQINFCVPTGNFGNILAGYYARQMGLPVAKLLCASNDNSVLTDFFAEGAYDTNRPFYKTISPSMDILVSSNLERLLFEISGRDAELTAQRMKALSEHKHYEITAEEREQLAKVFYADMATEDDTRDTIANMFDAEGYVMDPHTAVASAVYDNYFSETDDDTVTVVLSTASPYKFVADVLDAMGETLGKTTLKSVQKLNALSAIDIPESLEELSSLPVRFTQVLQKEEIADAVKAFASEK